jgi:hypothetical protein
MRSLNGGREEGRKEDSRIHVLVGGGEDPSTLQHLHREALLQMQTHASR